VRISRVRHRVALLLAALLGALAVVLGGGGTGSTPPEALAEPGRDLSRFAEELAGGSSRAVVRRLESTVAERPSARSLALLGLGYQQLARETGDASWLGRSVEALRRARTAAPEDRLALVGSAQLAVTQHRFREGERQARRALAQDPDDALALAALGDALVALGRHREAFRTYDRLAALGPSVGAYSRVATARQLLGRPAAAIDAMELALEAGSGIPEQEAWALTRYATLLVAAGRLDEAEDALWRALRLVPGYLHADAGLARVAAARGSFGAAARRLESVVTRLPLPEYAILLGEVRSREGRPRAAREAYRLVATLDRLLEANGVRTELQTALFDLDRGTRSEDSLARARAAYDAAPGVAAADAVAWGLARSGRCAAARAWSRRALSLGTKDGLFLFHRGMIERCLGGADAGRPWFRRALAANPTFSLRWAPLAARLAR
jgi:tetratricopeptide (TPR) repeat protein